VSDGITTKLDSAQKREDSAIINLQQTPLKQ